MPLILRFREVVRVTGTAVGTLFIWTSSGHAELGPICCCDRGEEVGRGAKGFTRRGREFEGGVGNCDRIGSGWAAMTAVLKV